MGNANLLDIKNTMQNSISKLPMIIIACFTLGLAPFAPEPHIIGKIRWVAGGAVGMKGMDWFDLVLHGTPWVLLLIYLTKLFVKRVKG